MYYVEFILKNYCDFSLGCLSMFMRQTRTIAFYLHTKSERAMLCFASATNERKIKFVPPESTAAGKRHVNSALLPLETEAAMEPRGLLLTLAAASVLLLLLLPPASAVFLGKKSALAAKKIAAISNLCE